MFILKDLTCKKKKLVKEKDFQRFYDPPSPFSLNKFHWKTHTRILKVTSQKYVFILLFIFFFIVRIIWHMLNKIYCDFLTIRCIPNSLPPNYKLATSNAGWWLGVSSLSATFLMEIKSLLCGNLRNVAVLRLRLWGQGPVSGPVWRVQDPSLLWDCDAEIPCQVLCGRSTSL